MGNFLIIDRSITVGHIDGGYLYRMPNFIPFEFHNEDFGLNVNYKLFGNRIFLVENIKDDYDASRIQIYYTGSLVGTYKNDFIEMEFIFVFENGLLRRRKLNKFNL